MRSAPSTSVAPRARSFAPSEAGCCLELLQELSHAAARCTHRIRLLDPSQTDHLSALDGDGAIRQLQDGHRATSSEGVSGVQVSPSPSEPVADALEQAVTTVTQRHQAITGGREATRSLEGRARAFESGRGNELHWLMPCHGMPASPAKISDDASSIVGSSGLERQPGPSQ